MNKMAYASMFLLAMIILLPINVACAQKALPRVPITYQGDTDETIVRRAQWIEAAKKEGALDWWGALVSDLGIRVIAEFNKVYPFIKMEYWRGKDMEMAAKLEAAAAGNRPIVDIVLGGDPINYPRWRKMGLMGSYTDIIPGIKTRDKRSYGRYGDWAQPGNNGAAPAYNTKKVSAAEAPKSWGDLLDPKWQGKIGLPVNDVVWPVMALEDGGWGVEKTEEYLRKLKQQQPVWLQGYAAGFALLVAGEISIMGDSFVYHTLQAQERGAPVEWCRVGPIPVTGPSFILQKMAPHPNAAKLFLEWVLSPQGLLAYDRITFYGSAAPGSGTRLSRALEGLPLVFRTEEGTIKAAEMNLDKRFQKVLGITPN